MVNLELKEVGTKLQSTASLMSWEWDHSEAFASTYLFGRGKEVYIT